MAPMIPPAIASLIEPVAAQRNTQREQQQARLNKLVHNLHSAVEWREIANIAAADIAAAANFDSGKWTIILPVHIAGVPLRLQWREVDEKSVELYATVYSELCGHVSYVHGAVTDNEPAALRAAIAEAVYQTLTERERYLHALQTELITAASRGEQRALDEAKATEAGQVIEAVEAALTAWRQDHQRAEALRRAKALADERTSEWQKLADVMFQVTVVHSGGRVYYALYTETGGVPEPTSNQTWHLYDKPGSLATTPTRFAVVDAVQVTLIAPSDRIVYKRELYQPLSVELMTGPNTPKPIADAWRQDMESIALEAQRCTLDK